jgi:hypothetical protein
MFNLVKKLSHCQCHRLTQGYPGTEAVQRSLIERLLLKFVPHFDIVKDIPACPECEGAGWNPKSYYPDPCGTCAGASVDRASHTVLYLRRFYIFRSRWFGLNFGDIYLHNIVRSDDDQDPHDHPWGFRGIVLRGGYTDERWYWAEYRCIPPTTKKGVRLGPVRESVEPFQFIRRVAEHIHRVRLNSGPQGDETQAWTLIFTSAYARDWHFITENGPVFWRRYLGIPDDVDVGE